MFDRLFNAMEKSRGWFNPQKEHLLENKNIESELSRNSKTNEEDVRKVKSILFNKGYYKPSEDIGETEEKMSIYPNENLFTSIKNYQRDNGLNVDGVMKPNGETEEYLMYMDDKDKGKYKTETMEMNDSDDTLVTVNGFTRRS